MANNYSALAGFEGGAYVLREESGYKIHNIGYDSKGHQLIVTYIDGKSNKLGLTSYQISKIATRPEYTVTEYPEKLGELDGTEVYGKTQGYDATVDFAADDGRVYKLHERLANNQQSELKTSELYKLLDYLEPSGNLLVLAVKNSFPVLG